MGKKLVKITILSIILLFIIIAFSPIYSCTEDYNIDNETWSYKQEVTLPISTTSKIVNNYPIDLQINFSNPCWAIDETYHSLRLIYQINDEEVEYIEFQIYNLKFIDKNHIKKCNIVFLIPDDANGKEKYYVIYDDQVKAAPEFPDHVSVKDSYYNYEPMQFLSLESWYYGIYQEDFMIYAVSQKGSTINEKTSQQVIKLKTGSKSAESTNFDQTASFSLDYWLKKNGKMTKSSTSEKLVSKEILVDGNLMVKFKIISESNDGYFQTSVIYTYFYNPTDNKTLKTQVRHEIINYPIPMGKGTDFTFVKLNNFDIKSNNIKELNFGQMYKYLHIFSEKERILTYDLDPSPDNKLQVVVPQKDDCDLGSQAWLSIDKGETGKAHAIIFNSPNLSLTGNNEKNGIEIQAFEGKLKGFQFFRINGKTVSIYIGRNAYEPESGLDEIIPKNYSVEFNAEFFNTDNGGFKAVEKESIIYQSIFNENYTIFQEQNNKSNNTIYSHKSKVYNLILNVTDSLGFKPDATLDIIITSEDFNNTLQFNAEKIKDGKYIFKDIYRANYTIKIFYKSYTYEKPIKINKNQSTDFIFPLNFNLTIYTFDSYGNILNNAKIIIYRNGLDIKSQEVKNGKSIFSIPPGDYNTKIYHEGNLVAQRKINVLNNKNLNIATSQKPLISILAFIIVFLFIIITGILSFIKKKTISYLKILAISLAILSFVSPWWVLHGSSITSEVNISTKLFLTPPKMVESIKTQELITGEPVLLPEIFTNVLNIITLMIVIACLLIVLSLFFTKINKNKISLVTTFIGLIILIITIFVFSYAMSEFSDISVGGLIGKENLQISIPGENTYENISCSWGLGLGFYFYLMSIITLTSVFIINLRDILIKKHKKFVIN